MKVFFLVAASIVFSATSLAEEKDQIAEQNIRKAIDAAGGEDRLNTIKAPTMWMETGTYYGMGEGVPFVAQYASYWPKRWYRQLIEGQFSLGAAGDQLTLFANGDVKGSKLSGAKAEETLHRMRITWSQLLYPFIDDQYTLSSIPGVDVDGKPTVGIKATRGEGSEIILYFDHSTFLISKTEAVVAAPEMGGKLVKSETFFTDHKSFGGAKLPSKYKILYDGKLMVEGETVAIKTHATLDPAWFGTEGPSRVR